MKWDEPPLDGSVRDGERVDEEREGEVYVVLEN